MVTVYDLTVAADPAQVATFGGQPVTATITAQAKDQFNTFPATGTPVQFTTSQGTLPGGGQTYNTTLNNGQASLVLTLAGSDDLAQVAALVSSIAETTTVDVVHPSMIVTASTDAAYITAGGLVTFSYQVENTGDITLSSVTVTDNFGSVSGCTGMLLAIGQVKACGPRSVTVNQTTANAVMVVGTALSANDTIASDTVTATVVTIDVEASPDAIMADGLSTATITATIQDEGALPLPDGTPVQFSTDLGTLANGGAATISGGQGQAVVTLTASSTAGLATVNAKLGQAIGSAYVTMINPFASLDITVTPGQTSVQSGGTVTYTYNLTNIGSVTLTSVSVVDDNGTPGNTSDDVVINCGSPTLPSGEARNCAPRSVAITQSVTNIVTAVGTDVTPGDITASDTTTVLVQNSVTYLPIVIRP
jgi:adhesin/invasin